MDKPRSAPKTMGNWLGPPRFIAFLVLLGISVPSFADIASPLRACLIGFDISAAIFALSTVPLFRSVEAEHMREAARRNDANRWLLLAVSVILLIAVLGAIGLEIIGKSSLSGSEKALIVGTLAMAWIFANLVYALHYAHMFYVADQTGADRGGIDFPDTPEPDYWDFLYFAFTLGMTFQTSDVEIRSRAVRQVVTLHCVAAFVFNIGVLAFTINVLGN